MTFSSCALYSLHDYAAWPIVVKSSNTLIIDGEIAVPVCNRYIDSDGTDLPISAHRGLYIVLCMRSCIEGVTVLV